MNVRVFSALFLGILPIVAGSGCGNNDDGNFSEVGRAQIIIEPEEVVFGMVNEGEEVSRRVEISNPGTETLNIASWNWEGFHDDFSVVGLDGLNIEPNEFAYVTITFTPTDNQINDATIVLEANAANNSDPRIHVLSQEQSGAIMALPNPIYISGTHVNETVSVNVEIYNSGTDNINLEDGWMYTSSGELELSSQPTYPFVLAANQTEIFTIAYTPTGPGSEEAELILTCDAPNCENSRYRVPVHAVLETPYLVVSPPAVGFEPTAIGETSTESLLVRNQGDATLHVSSLAFAFDPEADAQEIFVDSIGETPYDVSDSSFDVEAGEMVEITLSYSPLDAQTDNEDLVIRSDDPQLPLTQVQVAGAPAMPILEVFPSELNFPLVAVDYEATLSVTIRNGGTELLELGEVSRRGDEAFSLLNYDSYPDSLDPEETFDLQVQFRPDTALVDFGGSLIVTAENDPNNSEKFVVLSGTSDTEPICRIIPIPMSVDFGTCARGSQTEEMLIFRNDGSGPCNVSEIKMETATGLFPYSQNIRIASISPANYNASTLGPGEEIEVTLSYFPIAVSDPTGLGDLFGEGASVEVVATDATSNEQIICGSPNGLMPTPTRLCGANVLARSAVASLGTVPSNIDFGLVTIGCNSQTMEIRIYNTGGADVELTEIYLEDCSSEFQLAGVPTMPSTLIAGDATAIDVRYRPNTEENDACRVVIESGSETDRLIVPLTGAGTSNAHQIDYFEQVSGQDVDVLFVVDNSGSMEEEQGNLRDSFSEFIESAHAWGTNFQIGVVTTDATVEMGDGIPNPTGGVLEPGELLGNVSTRIITNRTPAYEAVFQEVIMVGTTAVSNGESGLESARIALSDPVITDLNIDCSSCEEPYQCIEGANITPAMCGGYNRTFLRETASLEIVFVSDEDDQSPATLAYYEDFFRNIKGFRNSALFHASAIVGPRGGCGEAEAGQRYLDIADATGGATGSICASNFSASLSEIGNRAFGLRVQFFLSRVPDPTSIIMRVDGSPSPSGWTYDPDSNAIVWDDANVPQPGDDFEVEYNALCF